MTPYIIDVRRLVKDLGGITKVWRRSQELGYRLGYDAVEKWVLRNRPPNATLLLNLVLHAQMSDGVEIDIFNYLSLSIDPTAELGATEPESV